MRFPKFSLRKKNPNEICFHSFPQLVFTWPLILAGFLFYGLDAANLIQPATLGWIYGWVFVVTILTLGVDQDRNHFAFWLVVIALIVVVIMYIELARHVVIIGHIHHFFNGLKMDYPRDWCLFASIMLSIFYGLMICETRLNDKWIVSHNKFEHVAFGRTDVSLGKGAKGTKTVYPDILQLIFCLSGDLIITSGDGTKYLRIIRNVPLLPFVNARVRKILDATAVTPAEEQEVAAVLEDDEHEGDHDDHEDEAEHVEARS